jgi:hypothetical protein
VIDIKREEYTTMRQFVDAFRQNLNIAKDNKFVLSNYVVAYLFIRKIQDELPVFVETSKAMKLIHENMTDHDVLRLMNEAVDRLTARTKSMPAVPKASDNKNPPCSEGFDPSKLRGAPPKDRNVEEWVAEQLLKTTNNNTCAYCRIYGHDASICHCLRPDLHHHQFKNRRGIWTHCGPVIKPKPNDKKPKAEENVKANMAVTFDMNNDFACMALPAIAPQSTAEDRVQA